MFWARVPKPTSALQTLATVTKTIASGSVFAITTTAFSCTLAIAIEGAAHKTLYYFKPDWYQDVTYAYGLPQLEHKHDATVVCDMVGAITASDHSRSTSEDNVDMESHLMQAVEEEHAELERAEQQHALKWNDRDETVFTTGFSSRSREEERSKSRRRTLTLPTPDQLAAHVLSTAFTA